MLLLSVCLQSTLYESLFFSSVYSASFSFSSTSVVSTSNSKWVKTTVSLLCLLISFAFGCSGTSSALQFLMVRHTSLLCSWSRCRVLLLYTCVMSCTESHYPWCFLSRPRWEWRGRGGIPGVSVTERETPLSHRCHLWHHWSVLIRSQDPAAVGTVKYFTYSSCSINVSACLYLLTFSDNKLFAYGYCWPTSYMHWFLEIALASLDTTWHCLLSQQSQKEHLGFVIIHRRNKNRNNIR